MTSTPTPSSFTFTFEKGISQAEAAIIARAMAELIKLQPAQDTWRYSIQCPPAEAYALGVATAELVGNLAKLQSTTNGHTPKADAGKSGRPHNASAKKAAAKKARKSPGSRRTREPGSRDKTNPDLICKICAEVFKRKKSLATHMQLSHPTDTPTWSPASTSAA